jgi:YHS domain-containing protein
MIGDAPLQLTSFETDGQTIRAGYACPCGCTPSVSYQRGAEPVVSHCCCGNEFALGPRAEVTLRPRDGFALETELRASGWGEQVTAAWLVGPSVHPDPSTDDDGHDHHHHGDDDSTAIDPVCGMHVERAGAITKGLHRQHEGADYYFCGKGCYLEFGDDPARYLDPSYVPSM